MTDAQYIKKDDSPKSIFNPMKIDFIDEIRDDDNKVKKYVVPSFEIADFPTYITNRIIEDLILAVMNEREISPFDEEKMKEIRQEIEVVL